MPAGASKPGRRIGHDPVRSFRIPTPIYEAALARARAQGESLTAVVRRALEKYAKGKL